VLGMGLPATACYIITATIAAPALQQMGVTPIAAHFFAFYYGTMSAVVPPVALTSYTAAGLAGAKPMRVAIHGFGLALSGLLLPYLFVYNNALLLVDTTLKAYLFTVSMALVGVFSLSVGIIGMLKTNMPVWERVLFAVIGIGMVSPLGVYKLAGLVLFTGMVVQHYWRNKKILENPQPDTL